MSTHPKHLPADERRTVTVEAVVALAGESNPAEITTSAIAKHMKLTQGALFRHFPTKDAIWQAVMEWVTTRLLHRIEAVGGGQANEAVGRDGQVARPGRGPAPGGRDEAAELVRRAASLDLGEGPAGRREVFRPGGGDEAEMGGPFAEESGRIDEEAAAAAVGEVDVERGLA